MYCFTATVRQGFQDPERYVFLFKLLNLYFAVLLVLDVYPGSRIPNPKTATKERGAKNICCIFFVATNFTKLKIVLFLNWWRKEVGQFTKNYRT